MKQFILQVPEQKARFFTELIQSLGFVKTKEINEITSFEVPEEHKKIVRERMKSSHPSELLDWDDALKKIKVD